VLPVADAVRVAHELGLLALVDVAQTAGCWPIDFERDGMDFLAFTGHKSMMGPPGTGGLVVSERVDVRSIRPLKTGGTGSRSEQFEHPDFMPDRFEAGTPNAVGLAGLAAGVGAVLAAGVEEVRARERQLTDRLLAGLSAIEGVELCGVAPAGERIPVVSFRVLGMSPSEVGARLDEGFGVMARVGLQCSPAAHRTIGTFPAGTVRLSPGWLSAVEEVDAAVEAVACVAAEGSGR
jgi:selenocysteine lyase/cysteine desulfurase